MDNCFRSCGRGVDSWGRGRVACSWLGLVGVGNVGRLGMKRFDDEAEFGDVERGARSGRDALEPLALAAPRKLERAVVAIGVIAGAPEQAEGRPGAAGPTFVGVVTSAAETPEIVDGAIARVAKGRRSLP